MTSDIGAVQDFIDTALLGMVVDVMTLDGMIGVMWYLNWRFTLIALSVAPVLVAVGHHDTRRIKSASREVRKHEGILLSLGGADCRHRLALETVSVIFERSRNCLVL